jgi:hypothetical protein
MNRLFHCVKSFTGGVGVEKRNVSKVWSMSMMFFNNGKVFNANLSYWSISQVMDMSDMLFDAKRQGKPIKMGCFKGQAYGIHVQKG